MSNQPDGPGQPHNPSDELPGVGEPPSPYGVSAMPPPQQTAGDLSVPGMLTAASIVLILGALPWLVFPLIAGFIGDADPGGTRTDPALYELVMPVASVVTAALGVLARTGLNALRVALTVSTGFLGLVSLLTLAIIANELSEIRPDGAFADPAAAIIITVAFTASVILTWVGLVLLYLPSTNTFFTRVRHLRRQQRHQR
ncbi:hypothetical protein [Actinokineospora sp.]|uniref:hypothetical protein n=1 Tax=Actinokineospora sp. TaxID=1872133 RepID=UPI004037C0D8